MKRATPIVGAVSVVVAYEFEGHGWLETSVGPNNYEGFDSTAAGLEYDGRIYGRTGWNSDTGHVYYSTRRQFAKVIKDV